MFRICFPRKGTLTLTPGMGVCVGGHLGPKITNHLPKRFRTKIVHTSGTLFQKFYKQIFKIYSYIQKNTKSPINALKIATYTTKYTQNTNIHFQKPKVFEQIENTPIDFFIVHQNSIVYILYILYIL